MIKIICNVLNLIKFEWMKFFFNILLTVLFYNQAQAGFIPSSVLQNTLPVKALAFTATDLKTNGKVRVKWTTTSEKNLKEYLVYRSVDEQNWYVVANIPAKNSSGINNYEFVDGTGSGGINYYKLEAFDTGGVSEILKYTKVDLEDMDKVVRIYPNPPAGQIKLESAEQIQSIELELTDIFGRNYLVDFVRDNTHEITIITGPLTPGFYFLKCYLNKNRYVRKKTLII